MRKRAIPAAMNAPEGMHVLYADKSEDYRVTYIKDVVYAKRGDRELTLQMLRPGKAVMPGSNEKPEKLPCIVYVQGSAWMKQNVYANLPSLVDAARAGFVVASVEYRSSEEAKFPGFLLDVKRAIRFLKANAEEFGIDKERVGIWGDSSGGHTALMVGSTIWTREFDDEEYPEENSEVEAVVSFYGLSDITRINEAPRFPEVIPEDIGMIPENLLFGGNCKEHPELTAPGNPVNYIHSDKEYPPFLLVHGDEDGVVPFLQSVIMYDKLRECGKSVELYKVKGANHGIFMWTKETVDLVIKFFKAYIG